MTTHNSLFQGLLHARPEANVYEKSYHETDGLAAVMFFDNYILQLAVSGDRAVDFEGEDHGTLRLCPLSHHNRLLLNGHFPWTRPVACGRERGSIGLGDRLGLASIGHISAVRGRKIFPVLAQQSMRELTLTGRNYAGVLDDAAFAVFMQNWQSGYGADGDHLKKKEDIRHALDFGYSMITLDCSEQIDCNASSFSESDLEQKAQELLGSSYAGALARYTVSNPAHITAMTAQELHLNVVTYEQAIRYTDEVYHELIATTGRDIDFELSIDETTTPTTPAAHWYVSEELQQRGIEVTSLAPRFCGEFQKGIDYRGDLTQFETELAIHAALADHYGYKLSIHSGSDKFSIFNLIGKHTGLRVHVKTAGTNWLEALRVISATDPALYRELHTFAGEHLDEARAWYHVSCDQGKVEPAALRADHDLPRYLDEDDARQMLHITYGLILTAQHADGSPLFRTRIYDHLARHEGAYVSALRAHIGRHLDTLGYPPAEQ